MYLTKKRKFSFWLSLNRAFLVLIAAIFGIGQAAAVELTDVNFKTLADGKAQIHMSFDGPAPSLSAYAVEDPTRLVLDLKQTKSKLNKKSYNVQHDNVNHAVAVSAGDRVRFVVDMKELQPHSSSIQGSNLYITIGDKSSVAGSGVAQAQQANTAQRARSAATQLAQATQQNASRAVDNQQALTLVKNSVQRVDFERTTIGSGDVKIQLANSAFQSKVKRSGSAVIVEFPRALLSSSVEKVSNLAQFGTLVKSIQTKKSGDNVIVTINTGGNFDFDSYQVDDMYVVSFSPKRGRQPTPATSKNKTVLNDKTYTGELLSLNFQDIEVRSVLQLIADFTNLNLVASDSVQGNITLRLKNVPWDQALDIVLKAKGLDKRREGNVLLVAPADEISERERKELEASQQLQALAPLYTEHIKIKYADASEIFELFLQSNNRSNNTGSGRNDNDDDDVGTRGDDSETESTGSILSPRGSVIVDERTNSLFVTETAERLVNLKNLINKIDIPIRQVMIEARIVLANKDAAKSLGVKWGGGRRIGNTSIGGGLGVTSNPASPGFTGSNLISDFGVSSAPSSVLNIGRVIGGSGVLSLQLQALEDSGNGEVVSRPKVITGDKQEAFIKSGQEIPFVSASGEGAFSTEFKEVVLELKVTPYITPDGRVIMDLQITQDTVGENVNVAGTGGTAPGIDTTELKTQVLTSDGETIVLGGVFSEASQVNVSKTPLLGDLPIIGGFFSSTERTARKSETLIFITPKIINDKLIN